MTDTPVSEPAKEWEYRNMTCRLYRLDDIRLLGYVRVGDVWHNVYDSDVFDEDPLRDATNEVEMKVDVVITQATREKSDDPDPFDYPVPDPNPHPLPDYDPNPFPDIDPDPFPGSGPHWHIGNGSGSFRITNQPDDGAANANLGQWGLVNVRTSDGEWETMSIGELDVEDVNDDGTVNVQ